MKIKGNLSSHTFEGLLFFVLEIASSVAVFESGEESFRFVSICYTVS
jgi:hypothetical protein